MLQHRAAEHVRPAAKHECCCIARSDLLYKRATTVWRKQRPHLRSLALRWRDAGLATHVSRSCTAGDLAGAAWRCCVVTLPCISQQSAVHESLMAGKAPGSVGHGKPIGARLDASHAAQHTQFMLGQQDHTRPISSWRKQGRACAAYFVMTSQSAGFA